MFIRITIYTDGVVKGKKQYIYIYIYMNKIG